MQCPACGYMMSAFDKDCPRCQGKGMAAPAAKASLPVPPLTPPPLNAPPLTKTAASPQAAYHSFPPMSAWEKYAAIVGWSAAVLLGVGAIVLMLKDNLLGFLGLSCLAIVPPVVAIVGADRTRPNMMVETLTAEANSTKAFVDPTGKGISIDNAARRVITSRREKDGFWIQAFPVTDLTFQLHQNTDSYTQTKGFSGVGCLAGGCLLGPLAGILSGMAFGKRTVESKYSYRLRLLTKNSEYPEHTVDFGADRERAERYEAQLRALLP